MSEKNESTMNGVSDDMEKSRKRRRVGGNYRDLCERVQRTVELNNRKVKDNLKEKIVVLAKIGNSEGVIPTKQVDNVLGEDDCYNMNDVIDMMKEEEGFYVTVLYDWMFEESVKDFVYFDILQKV